jgi:hypothetical protein
MLVGEVTVRLAELLAPGERERPELLHTPIQPLSRLAFRLKFVAEHPELSLSVTFTVNVTGVPGATDWLWDGDIVTRGLARVHVLPPVTTYVAAALPE